MDSQMTKLYAQRARTYYNRGDYENAILDFNKAIERHPTDPNLYYGRGAAFHKIGDYDRALLDCDMALQMNPKLSGAY